MLLTNYDCYDIYWSIVLLRADDKFEYDFAVIKAMKDTIDDKQEDNAVEWNIVRNALSKIAELQDDPKWEWIFTKNVYTYGVRIIKAPLPYQILSAAFDEMMTCLKQPVAEQLYDLKDALHNVPIILAEQGKRAEKQILREISNYRKKWNRSFLKSVLKK